MWCVFNSSALRVPFVVTQRRGRYNLYYLAERLSNRQECRRCRCMRSLWYNATSTDFHRNRVSFTTERDVINLPEVCNLFFLQRQAMAGRMCENWSGCMEVMPRWMHCNKAPRYRAINIYFFHNMFVRACVSKFYFNFLAAKVTYLTQLRTESDRVHLHLVSADRCTVDRPASSMSRVHQSFASYYLIT